MGIVSLSPFHMVNIGRRMLVNPRRRFTIEALFGIGELVVEAIGATSMPRVIGF